MTMGVFAECFAPYNIPIGLDTLVPREQADCIVSPNRRDPYPVNRRKFIYKSCFKFKAKRGVPPRQLISIRQKPSPLSEQKGDMRVALAVPTHTVHVRLASREEEF
jgi:hypothetical protein